MDIFFLGELIDCWHVSGINITFGSSHTVSIACENDECSYDCSLISKGVSDWLTESLSEHDF